MVQKKACGGLTCKKTGAHHDTEKKQTAYNQEYLP